MMNCDSTGLREFIDMLSVRRQSASLPSIEGSGELPDEDITMHGQLHAANVTSISLTSLPLPPLYPCNEVCAHCGKKVDVNLNDEQRDTTDGNTGCSCECHRQASAQSEKASTIQEHIPPRGPNCLPGCGYSGLPCYNCSFQTYLQQPPESLSQQNNQGFPTQIYTVELVSPSSLDNFQSVNSATPEIRNIPQSEESPEAARRRKNCISMIVFIVTINVAIAIIRMLSSITGI
ncbi:uncharacterized protein [Palaemon carinicauda]|uniref:uncharacterized protein isoform X2 n=1 Tax=Palaemon carinicauda TaxID=392227 RepID=UPI0035B60044